MKGISLRRRTQRQCSTFSGRVYALSFCRVAMLKICSVLADLRAIIWLSGFIMTLSADISRRWGELGFAMSMMTHSNFSPTFSRTQMYLGLS